MAKPVLTVKNLLKNYNVGGGLFASGRGTGIPAIDGVDFTLFPGETLGLIGESGSGKTSLGRAICKLTPVQEGEIHLFDENITHLSERVFKSHRKHIQMIFQDLDAALNPNMKIRQLMRDIFKLHNKKQNINKQIEDMLHSVNLDASVLEKYPNELSGGQKRRIAIANILASKPNIIIADEPTTGLDNYTQNLILQLIKKLQQEHEIAMLLISHDLQVIKDSCQRVIVLYLGKIVEIAPIEILASHPAHHYTQLLWSSYEGAQVIDKVKTVRKHDVRSGLHDFARPKDGCRFAPRCPKYQAEGKPSVCHSPENTPSLQQLAENHYVACHFPAKS